MLFIKKAGLFLLILIFVFVIINFHYFNKQFIYSVSKPQVQEVVNLAPNRIRIASLNISAPIIYPQSVNEDSFQDALKYGVAHYPGTAKPGQSGNVYLFGHSSDFPFSEGDYKTVFALLPRIEIGAMIEITDSDGKQFNYVVEEKFVASANAIELIKQDYSKKKLTLQTSYPLGTALKRFIVIAQIK